MTIFSRSLINLLLTNQYTDKDSIIENLIASLAIYNKTERKNYFSYGIRKDEKKN